MHQTVSSMVAEQGQGELLAMLNAITVNVGDVHLRTGRDAALDRSRCLHH